MRLVIVSDTHGMHRRMLHPVPDGDVLIHCGDMTGRESHSIYDVCDVAKWMGEQPHRFKLAIAGNHDAALNTVLFEPNCRTAFSRNGVQYLMDASVEFSGMKFWGAPWTPNFYDWHFMPPRHSPEMKARWGLIPLDTQVLITHGPPYGTLDETCVRYQQAGAQDHAGCELLRDRLVELKQLRLHCFGHIHEGYGMLGQYYETGGGCIYVNASTCNRNYEPVNRPVVVDL